MKKASLFILTLVLVFGLVLQGCSSTTNEGNNSGNDNGQSSGDYPERDITIVLGWGAGGGTDSFSRAIAKPLSDNLGVNVNVVNKPGASGSIAADYVSKQPADGYTFWAMTTQYPINLAYGKASHKLSEFKPIARVQNDVMTLQVKGGSKYQDIDKLVQAAKDNPGDISIGGSGSTGLYASNVKFLEDAIGADINYVPYSDAGEMHAALLGGHIDAQVEEIGPNISQIKKGKIDVSLVFAKERLEDYPDVPTTVEEGWDLTAGMGRGLMVKKGTPDKVVKAIQKAVKEAQEDEGYLEYEKNNLLDLREGWLDSEGFGKLLNDMLGTYKDLAKEESSH
ncbi:tripartite tricarboxylate transporter substrate binding protein [Tuberibacillus sp. Marseille-P3662]|uniref:tripartite tricarboxylate transporter substrate binding protein n=1 Tax=Tuberibacillus sp. Marseille-P3662 TaxID=1965358 RepID=UPI001593745E|nr:tripartite tricarboxylate transporter substrate binding protein [Tuberibacillus sp. Marseille-P3662]